MFFPLWPSSPAAGTLPSLTSKVLLFILRPLGIISWRPCPRVRPRRHATQRARSEIFKLSLIHCRLCASCAMRIAHHRSAVALSLVKPASGKTWGNVTGPGKTVTVTCQWGKLRKPGLGTRDSVTFGESLDPSMASKLTPPWLQSKMGLNWRQFKIHGHLCTSMFNVHRLSSVALLAKPGDLIKIVADFCLKL